MRFGFFKKKGDGNARKDSDLFDPTHDALDFDELEESGEFLADDGSDSTPGPPAYQPPPPPPPVPQQQAPRQPAPLPPVPSPSKLPPAAPPRPATPPPAPAAPPVYDDLTMINQPPPAPRASAPQVQPPAPPPARPAAPPARPAPPAPLSPQAAPPPPPPRVGDDDVTMILSAPVGEESVVAWLVVASEPGRGRDFRLPGGMARIGIDADCEICVDSDTYVSGRHAEISYRNGQYQLRDLNSTNGSFVNEVRINEAALSDNDRVRLGQTTFIFKSLKL